MSTKKPTKDPNPTKKPALPSKTSQEKPPSNPSKPLENPSKPLENSPNPVETLTNPVETLTKPVENPLKNNSELTEIPLEKPLNASPLEKPEEIGESSAKKQKKAQLLQEFLKIAPQTIAAKSKTDVNLLQNSYKSAYQQVISQ